MSAPLIKVEGVSKKFCRNFRKSLLFGIQDIGRELLGKSHSHRDQLREDEFWAVRNVSFELRRGECLGLIGRNGAGKSTLLRMLNGLIKPDQGKIEIRGKIGALISLGAGFNPILTGRENIYVNAAVLGLSKSQTDSKIDGIIEFSELGEFIDTPVQNYSAGMQMRLGFSVASSLDPDVLLIDEVLAVGDTQFRAKCFKRIGETLSNAAVIFVSHNEAQIQRICDAALYLNKGTVRFLGETSGALQLYRNDHVESTPDARFIMHQGVTAVRIFSGRACVVWGGSLTVELELELAQDIAPGIMYVHFARDDEYKATAEYSFKASDGQSILKAGRQIMELIIGPMYLAHGRYHMSFSLFDSNGKSTIFQALDLAALDVNGPVGQGPSCLLPIEIPGRVSKAEIQSLKS